jgi:hypothetical protein
MTDIETKAQTYFDRLFELFDQNYKNVNDLSAYNKNMIRKSFECNIDIGKLFSFQYDTHTLINEQRIALNLMGVIV